MGLYHQTGENPSVPVVPDAFLSLSVERKKQGKSRLSYVMWEENEVLPIMTLETVSHTPVGSMSGSERFIANSVCCITSSTILSIGSEISTNRLRFKSLLMEIVSVKLTG